ncbi:MAG: DUF4846 domain-containing protein [Bacteroides sp.]|nr:DUF4846 domain-containing protein [Bacteroides sp.]
MKKNYFTLLYLGLFLTFTGISGCGSSESRQDTDSDTIILNEDNKSDFSDSQTVRTRYHLPAGFYRTTPSRGSWEEFLQNLPLTGKDAAPFVFNGVQREQQGYTSVADVDTDSLDLHHSVNAVVRLRAEYLFDSGQYDKIHFTLNNNSRCDFLKWAQEFQASDNEKKAGSNDSSKENGFSHGVFLTYLRFILAHIDQKSFLSDMEEISEENFGIGTVIIDSKPPYACAIVVDYIKAGVDKNGLNDSDAVLLAQGGILSQDIVILDGNYREGLFSPNQDEDRYYSSIWTTTSKGERPIRSQGGRLFSGDQCFKEKRLLKFKN